MRQLQIVAQWLAGGDGDPIDRATFGSLEITAGPEQTPLTEAEDTVARTVRRYIYVPAAPIAEWLLTNWWRLRWEGQSAKPSGDWRRAHTLAAIGGGYAWPNLEISSDGEFVQLRARAEPAADVAGIRYLRDASLDIHAQEFESAVDAFIDEVAGRLATCLPSATTISELRAELQDERARPSISEECKWQALAGLNPGDASDAWVNEARELAEDVGTEASGEVFAALDDGKLGSARDALSAMRASTTTVDLRRVGVGDLPKPSPTALPWERGADAARTFRLVHGLGRGPVSDQALQDLLSVALPLPRDVGKRTHALAGGFRNGVTNGRTAIVVTSPRPETQRFYLARLIACALTAPDAQHLLPVTPAATAMQKMERSFAQELLCPWSELDAFTDEHGMDEEGVAAAAGHFAVSEWLILSTLVNRRKLSRDRLPER